MNRFHVHVAVDDLEANIRFYSAVFGTEPSVRKEDYAKWMLEDPRINFAISKRGEPLGVNHLGIQVENASDLGEIESRLKEAKLPALAQAGAACCYAKSDKYWTVDPQGVAWESFHTLEQIPVFGGDTSVVASKAEATTASCCAPGVQAVTVAERKHACCG
jgi:catechol 2,3-dioxygenase-like lactoylglutathione lyase family enzyme